MQSKEISQLKDLYNKSAEEVNEYRNRVDSLTGTNECQRDEIKQLTALYQTEREAAATLEKALSTEKDNFR